MTENKLLIACADLNGLDPEIANTAVSIENFLINAGATSNEYTRVDLLRLAVDMKKVEILGDMEEDLSILKNYLLSKMGRRVI